MQANMNWLLVLPVFTIGVLSIQSDQPARMTTEGAEYCQALTVRFSALPTTTELSRKLAEEGRRLCAMGQYRAGIARLRRAIRAAKTVARRADLPGGSPAVRR
jgi:hypothetical protein